MVTNQYRATVEERVSASGDEEKNPPIVLERFEVALIAEAAEALRKLQERTELNKVDIINRALTIYEFIDAEQRAGDTLWLRNEAAKRERSFKID